MDIKSLKDKILQLAIEGKLVPQDENDEPASVLLEKIKAEKEQLIKNKVIKKEKPLPDISEEMLFELPDGWKWCRFSDICSFKIGKTPKRAEKKYWTDGEIPWVSISDLIDGKEINNTKEKITYLADKEVFKGNISKKGTLIMSFKLSIGKVSILAMDAYHNEAIISIKPYTDYNEILKIYLFKVLPILDLASDTKNAIKGSTLNSESIRNILVPLPPLEEQKRIVDKINELFDLVDTLDKNKQDLLENISNTRNKVLQLAIQGKLVEQCENDEPASVLLERIKAEKEQLIKDKVIKKEKPLPEISEEEKLFDIPKSWQWVRLGEVTNYGKNKSIQGNLIDDNTWVLELEDIERDTSKIIQKIYYKDRKSKSNKLVFEIGDVLYSKLRPYLNKIVLAEDSGVCSSEIMPIKSYGNYIYPKYLLYSMKSKSFITYVNNITYGTKMPRLNTEDGRKILIPLPPLEEQKRIVAKVDLIMDYLGKLQQEVESQEIILKDIIQ